MKCITPRGGLAVLLVATLPVLACGGGDEGEARDGAGAAADSAAATPAGAPSTPGSVHGDSVDTGTPVQLTPIDRSGVAGSVVMERSGSEVSVTVHATGLTPDAHYTAVVHEGRCAAGGAIVVPLGELRADSDSAGSAGVRTATAALPGDRPLFVQVEAAGGRPVACADLPGGEDEPSLMPRPES